MRMFWPVACVPLKFRLKSPIFPLTPNFPKRSPPTNEQKRCLYKGKLGFGFFWGEKMRAISTSRTTNLNSKNLSPLKENLLFLKFLPHSEKGKGKTCAFCLLLWMLEFVVCTLLFAFPCSRHFDREEDEHGWGQVLLYVVHCNVLLLGFFLLLFWVGSAGKWAGN